MSVAFPPPSRAILWLLFAMLGMLAAPRAAMATGCHGPERAALGLLDSWDSHARIEEYPGAVMGPRAILPARCPPELPWLTSRPILPAAFPLGSPSFHPSKPIGVAIPASEVLTLPSVASRLERPPRATMAATSGRDTPTPSSRV